MTNKKEYALWNTFDNLRGKIGISDLKDYILSLLFYKYLSEDMIGIDTITELLQKKNQTDITTLLRDNFTKIEQHDDYFANIFSSIDLSYTKLGRTKKAREIFLKELLLSIDSLRKDEIASVFDVVLNREVIYTPSEISTLLAKIVSLNRESILSVYNPNCNRASVLIKIGEECSVAKYYGQEIRQFDYNIARMNMIVHGISCKNISFQLKGTLDGLKKLDKKFEVVVSVILPLGLYTFGFDFIQHSLVHLEDNGTMAIIIPNKILFKNREKLIKDIDSLDTIISLPSNIFYNTDMATSILIFKKNRKTSKDILFIDASTHFVKHKNQNYLTQSSIDKILTTYKDRSSIKSYSRVVKLKEIERNNFNLNVPRYIQYSNSLNSLYIKNFKSLTNIKIDNIPNFSVFAGSNGSGKSNLFEALEFMRDVIRYGANEAIKKHNGYNNISSYKLKGKNRKTFFAQMEVAIGSNLKSLEKDKFIFQDILESMQIIVPEFEKFSTQTDKYTNKSILVFKEGGRNKFPAGLISDGTIYALAMLTIIYSNTKGIVLIEEPERGLNPKAISELIELFREKSENINIFINTHNETIVRETQPQELFLVVKKEGKTEIKNVKESFPNYDYSKMEIDKMWLSNIFDGGLPW